MSDQWIFRELSGEFFEKAGHYPPEETQRLFEEIPSEYKLLAYAIIDLTGRFPNNSCVEFRHLLFALYKQLQENGINIKLPYYWFVDGVMIEPEWIVRATNGIVGFKCDDSWKECGRTKECRFYKG